MNPNDPTPDFSDEQVMAFVDGELDDDSARRLRDALPRDPALARRVEAERALRARLTRAFASDLDEPVPDRLRGLLPSGAAATTDSAAPAPVADLAAARASRRTSSPALRWAMAAMVPRSPRTQTMLVIQNGRTASTPIFSS